MQRRGNGKPKFEPIATMHLDLTEATANLDHILISVRQQYGAGYILVNVDGLEIEDSPTTQGKKLHGNTSTSITSFFFFTIT